MFRLHQNAEYLIVIINWRKYGEIVGFSFQIKSLRYPGISMIHHQKRLDGYKGPTKDMIFFVSVACQIKGIGLGRTFSKRNLASDMSFGAYPQSPVLEIRTRVRTLHQSVLKERFTTSLA